MKQRGLDSPSQVSPFLCIIFKAFTCTHGHTLELSTSRGKVVVVMILLVESSSQIFPVSNICSFQLVEPFKLSPWQTILKEMNPHISISGVGLDLSDIRAEMEFSAGLLRDDHSWHQSQFFEIQSRYPLNFHGTQTIFQLLVFILSRRILLIIVVGIIVRNCRTEVLLPCLFFLIPLP